MQSLTERGWELPISLHCLHDKAPSFLWHLVPFFWWALEILSGFKSPFKWCMAMGQNKRTQGTWLKGWASSYMRKKTCVVSASVLAPVTRSKRYTVSISIFIEWLGSPPGSSSSNFCLSLEPNAATLPVSHLRILWQIRTVDELDALLDTSDD